MMYRIFVSLVSFCCLYRRSCAGSSEKLLNLVKPTCFVFSSAFFLKDKFARGDEKGFIISMNCNLKEVETC